MLTGLVSWAWCDVIAGPDDFNGYGYFYVRPSHKLMVLEGVEIIGVPLIRTSKT